MAEFDEEAGDFIEKDNDHQWRPPYTNVIFETGEGTIIAVLNEPDTPVIPNRGDKVKLGRGHQGGDADDVDVKEEGRFRVEEISYEYDLITYPHSRDEDELVDQTFISVHIQVSEADEDT